MTIFIMVQGTVCVPRGAHLYIKGWLPSHINVAVTANEMRAGLSVSVCRHWHQTLCKLLQSETLWWWALQRGMYYWAERKWTIRWGVVNRDSSHVKSQCRTVLTTSNAITCLWHCGMRHRGGRTVIQARWWNVGSRSRNAKGKAESDEQGRNVPKSASVADCPVVALKCL